MSNEILEQYIKQTIEINQINEVLFTWQGGEPTIAGLDFFKKAVHFQKQYSREGMKIYNAIQTNGVLLNDTWGTFFQENQFLVGISLDGPEEIHNALRTDSIGNGSYLKVMRGINLLKRFGVEFNILCTINGVNESKPLEVYRFLRDDVKANFIQFIPVVNYDYNTGIVTPWSVKPDKYGRFLITIFDDWVKKDVGTVFIQLFDTALAGWCGQSHGICHLSPVCGQSIVIEHNGDVFSCDHFVDNTHKLGNILVNSIYDMIHDRKQIQFGLNKVEKLPEYCQKCKYLFVCHGECPKNRFIQTPDGEPGLNYLCEGYFDFFNHISKSMEYMRRELNFGRSPANIMRYFS